MSSRSQTQHSQPGDVLLVIHDFNARSGDELSLKRGEKIELIERDDDFGDGWFLGRHVDKEESGLFPEVYTTPAPKTKSRSTSAAGRPASSQSAQRLENEKPGVAESANDELATAPPVQPFATDRQGDQLDSQNMQSLPVHNSALGDRSVSAPLSYNNSPSTPPSGATPRSARPISTAQRSMSLSNGTHQNSPVMNETLSVIEEHITDMSTPRHSLLKPERNGYHNDDESTDPDAMRRLSYITGHETDEEESGMLSEKEVRAWTPDRVAEYLEDLGVEPHHCQVFREQEISGDVLLGMDQGSLMLKEFDLGSIGRRLALWQKVKAIQEEVRISRVVPRFSAEHSPIEGSFDESTRSRSTSVGTVLPRIPSLMEGSNSRVPSRQQLQRSPSGPSHQQPHQTESLSALPVIDSSKHGHEYRPSAASVRSLQHDRRHSSVDQSTTSADPDYGSQATAGAAPAASHTKKHGSFDRSWTMGSTLQSPSDSKTTLAGQQLSPSVDSFAAFPHEVNMTVVNSLDLDRGYFSGNEADNRKARNVLRKRDSPAHSRAPSDGFNTRRLSGAFRHRASAESLVDSPNASNSTAAQVYYSTRKPGFRATSTPQVGKSWRQASPTSSPTVTKLDYSHSPSIDAVTASPNAASEKSLSDRPAASPALQGRNPVARSRVTGLRAISDAITGDEKASALSPQFGKVPSSIKESPLQSPSRAGTGSTTPSMTSKSIDMDDSSLLKGAGSSGRHTPIMSAAPRRRGKKSTSAYLRGLEKKSPEVQMDGCDYSGWMKKKSSNLMTTWKTRLFVLRGRRLSYYYLEDDTEEKGLIDISFHRVLPANNDRITGLHATVTGATSSPTSPHNAHIQTTASANAQNAPDPGKGDAAGTFIFKLVPPRSGLSKAVNFTKPTVHYFAVDNVQQGRLWMAALMKATIDRDDTAQVTSTYKEKTVSLAKAKAMRQRPPALMGDEDDISSDRGLAIKYSDGSGEIAANGEKEGSLTTDGSAKTNSTENLDRGVTGA